MIELEGRRVAIVGGAGFIGHHLALSLAEQGAVVSVIDSLQVNNIVSITSAEPFRSHHDLYLRMLNQRLDLLREAGVPLLVQDARDYHALSRVLTDLEPQVVVHAAAVSHAGISNKDPFSTFDHSLRTLENALDAVREMDVHFIFLSSSMAYGDFRADEVDEEHPLNPIGIYGALKVAGEKIVIAYNQVFGSEYTIVRPSALYGPRCVSRRVGQIFIENALEGRALELQGDGSDRLDFTYVDDLVHGLELVITSPAARNETFNLTYGGARTIAELAAIVQEEFPHVELVKTVRDRLMPKRGTLSIEKARRMLGYEPSCPLEVGVPRYVDWYRSLVGSPAGRA